MLKPYQFLKVETPRAEFVPSPFQFLVQELQHPHSQFYQRGEGIRPEPAGVLAMIDVALSVKQKLGN